ncbi:MAG: hypothetical protein AB7J13_07890, partial [Pyrinomonadaceae bacterium]
MLVRAIVLSLALLVGGTVIIPLATEYAEAGSTARKKKKRSWRGVKKYSKRWWQLYRAQERRKRVRAKQRRALRLRQLRLAKARADKSGASVQTGQVTGAKNSGVDPSKTAMLPSGDQAPAGWRPAQASASELQFRVEDSSGSQVGSASISVVGPAVGTTTTAGRRRYVGGVPTTSLRREVIDKMIRENGWVVNDYQK